MNDPRTCPSCGRRMVCLSSRRVGEHQARYLACRRCDVRRTVVVPAAEVFRKSIVEREQIAANGNSDTLNSTLRRGAAC